MPPITAEQFNEMRKDYDRQIDDLRLVYATLQKETAGGFKNIETKLQSKVGYKIFWIIMGFLCSVLGGLLMIIYNQGLSLNDKLDNAIDKVSKTQSDVSLINGILKGAKVTE